VASETYDVFVTYSRLDGRHAAEIDSILRAKGLRPYSSSAGAAQTIRTVPLANWSARCP
jgi:hypothetical protein